MLVSAFMERTAKWRQLPEKQSSVLLLHMDLQEIQVCLQSCTLSLYSCIFLLGHGKTFHYKHPNLIFGRQAFLAWVSSLLAWGERFDSNPAIIVHLFFLLPGKIKWNIKKQTNKKTHLIVKDYFEVFCASGRCMGKVIRMVIC